MCACVRACIRACVHVVFVRLHACVRARVQIYFNTLCKDVTAGIWRSLSLKDVDGSCCIQLLQTGAMEKPS